MYRYAVKLGLKNNYNEENGIIKKNCADDVGHRFTTPSTGGNGIHGEKNMLVSNKFNHL